MKYYVVRLNGNLQVAGHSHEPAEHLGEIDKSERGEWLIDNGATYTIDEDAKASILADEDAKKAQHEIDKADKKAKHDALKALQKADLKNESDIKDAILNIIEVFS